MNCTWGYTWPGHFLYHNWLFWLLLAGVVVGIITLLLMYWRKEHQLTCPGCTGQVKAVYLRCPECGQELKRHCPGCHHIVDNSWQICPCCKEPLQTGAAKESTKTGVVSV